MKSFKSVIILFSMLLVFAFPAGTWAHSKLQSSIPAADAKVTEAVQELSLSFNEKIDSTLSTLSIKNDKGEKLDTTEVKVEENLLKASLEKPLDSGSYTVEWKIVGRDGHPVKGTYTFQVEAPKETPKETPDAVKDNTDENTTDKQENAAEDTNSDQEKPGKTPTPTNTDEAAVADNTPAEQPQSSSGDDESGSGNTLWIAIIVVIAGIGGYFALKQSRKKR